MMALTPALTGNGGSASADHHPSTRTLMLRPSCYGRGGGRLCARGPIFATGRDLDSARQPECDAKMSVMVPDCLPEVLMADNKPHQHMSVGPGCKLQVPHSSSSEVANCGNVGCQWFKLDTQAAAAQAVASATGCHHDNEQAEPPSHGIKDIIGIAHVKESSQPGPTRIQVQPELLPDTRQWDIVPTVTLQPACEGAALSRPLWDPHHDDGGVLLGMESWLKPEGPMITSHVAGSSGGGNCHGGVVQGQWRSREKASVDLLRDIDHLLAVPVSAEVLPRVTKGEPEDEETGALWQLHHLPASLVQHEPTGTRYPASLNASEEATGFPLPGPAISVLDEHDADPSVGLPSGVDEAEVERLAAVLMADIQEGKPDDEGLGEGQKSSSPRMLNSVVEVDANVALAAAQHPEASAENDELSDIAEEGLAEPPYTPSGLWIPSPYQAASGGVSGGGSGSDSAEGSTPIRGTKGDRPTGRVRRNRNYRTPGKYRGVRCRREGRYSAELKVGNVRKWLGTFPSAEEAARAFDAAAIEVSGSKAQLNFPLHEHTSSDQARQRKREDEQPSGRRDSRSRS